MVQAARVVAPDVRSRPDSRTANPLLAGPILPTLLRLTLPNLLAMLVTALVAIAETSYVGILGTAPLAAIALVFPMVMLMQMLSAGAMGGGVSSAISRALGAGDVARARVAGPARDRHRRRGRHRRSRSCSSPSVLPSSGRSAAAARCWTRRSPTPACAGGAVLIWLLNTLASIVRGTGNMRVPSLTLLGSAALQIGLGGVAGARLRTDPALRPRRRRLGLVIGFAAGALFLLWFLHSRPRTRDACAFRASACSRDMFLDILKVGALAAFSPLQTVLTVLVLTALVARFGTEALAGYGIGARLEFLLVPIVFAVGVACVPMVGMAIGAGDIARARRVAWTAAGLATLVLGGIGLTVATFPDVWSARFTQDAGVRAAADLYLRLAGPAFAFLGLGHGALLRLAGLRQGAGPGAGRRPSGWR